MGYSAAAGLALSQGAPGAGAAPVRVGMIGLGNRGTALLRAALDLPGFEIAAVCDRNLRNGQRCQGIVEKATGKRPDYVDQIAPLLARPDLDAVIAALPCDQHARVYGQALEADKHLFAEKPIAISHAECSTLRTQVAKAGNLAFQVGFQRRWSARYQDAVSRMQRGDIGSLLACECGWSGQGPIDARGGWLGRRARSGDLMLEQAVHLWDLLCWVQGGPPEVAFGHGRRDLFRAIDPERDVTDWYVAELTWPDGFHASVRHSWIDLPVHATQGLQVRFLGSDGAIDLGAGTVNYREKSRPREVLASSTTSDTHAALRAFLDAVRSDQGLAEPTKRNVEEAILASEVGLLVRRAVDERRCLSWQEAAAG